MSTDESHNGHPRSLPVISAVTPAPTESSHTTAGDEGLDDLMLKWEDHHKSFFELAEDLCHSEQFIDVTISCGDHNFPAHKLILSVCSPYFKNLFLRNPCKHPIVVLKDVHFKYMKLILIFMYRGEVAVPQEDLGGLLKVARSLQVRGLAEMTPTPLNPAAAVSPRKRYLSEMLVGGVTAADTSDIDSAVGGEFSIDDVKSRLHGQLEIQAVSIASPGSLPRTPPLPWGKYLAHSQFDDLHHHQPGHRSDRSESGPSEEDPHSQACKREVPDSWHPDSGSEDLRENGNKRHRSRSGGRRDSDLIHDYKAMLKRDRSMSLEEIKREKPGSYLAEERARSGSLEDRMCSSSSDMEDRNTPIALIKPSSNAGLIEAARAAGLDLQTNNKNGDPMSSISALLAAAQATGGVPPPPATTASLSSSMGLTSSTVVKTVTTTASNGGGTGRIAPVKVATPEANQGLDLSNPAAAMANVNAQMQLYYYMQKLQTAGMGNPKERKECPICAKTLYDRSTWNRHMRIHTGEKPYPCTFCGRRFRTNYNKLGHEKKCPDRHARALLQPTGQTENGGPTSGPPPAVPQPTPAAVPNAVYR